MPSELLIDDWNESFTVKIKIILIWCPIRNAKCYLSAWFYNFRPVLSTICVHNSVYHLCAMCTGISISSSHCHLLFLFPPHLWPLVPQLHWMTNGLFQSELFTLASAMVHSVVQPSMMAWASMPRLVKPLLLFSLSCCQQKLHYFGVLPQFLFIQGVYSLCKWGHQVLWNNIQLELDSNVKKICKRTADLKSEFKHSHYPQKVPNLQACFPKR